MLIFYFSSNKLNQSFHDMKNIFNVKLCFFFALIVCLFHCETGFSQLAVPFKVRYQSYVKGDMTVISNTIVNRKENRVSTAEPYNDISESAQLNDEFDMNYIDIDQDNTTFSSSSAQLNLENTSSKKIIYAGLYWAATYKYDAGIRDKKWNYVATDNNRTSVNEIKFKLPGQSEYIDVTGDILFDGLTVKNFKESAPYAVYADVTKYIQPLENPNGEYMVANIKATQGIISGGVAGGWTLFIVYEDQTETGKFITSFDGFVGITTRPVEILYTGFSTVPDGKVNAKLAGSVLEGDRTLVGDQLEIKSDDNLNYTLLSHSLKPVDNFFNSTMVINDSYYENRNPNSLNTLGYDTFMIPIDNQNNTVIKNNSTKVSLKLKSSGDRYSMFFSAFNVEVKDPVEQIETDLIASKVKSETQTPIVVHPDPVAIEKELKAAETSSVVVVNKAEAKKEEPKKVENPSVLEQALAEVENKAEADKPVEVKTSPKTEEAKTMEKPTTASGVVMENKVEEPKAVEKPTVMKQAVVEVEKKVETEKNPVAVETTPKAEETKAVEQPVRTFSSIRDMIRESEKMNTEIGSLSTKKRITVLPGADVLIPNQPKGYYVVANVFAKPTNATRFEAKLNQKGMEAKTLYNPNTNLRSVYIGKFSNWNDALNFYYSNAEGKYFDDLWIMLVNTSTGTILEP